MTDTDLLMLQSNRDAMRRQYEAARKATVEAQQAEHVAYAAYVAARVDLGRAQPHPWAGRKVRRIVTGERINHAAAPGQVRMVPVRKSERGTVVICEQDMRYRNYDPIPGEWFVLSPSGITAYRLDDRTGWELAPE